MKIDGHQHFWEYDPAQYPWISEEMEAIKMNFQPHDLEPLLQEYGFDGCVCVEARHSDEETATLLGYASDHDFIKGVVGWTDPYSAQVEEVLESLASDPLFKGIRHTEWDSRGEFLLNPDFQRTVACLGKFGLAIDLLVFHYQLESAVTLARNFPDQVFILDHCGNPDISEVVEPLWSKNIREIATQGNVYCKISGILNRVQKVQWQQEDLWHYLDVVAEAFGPDRLIFGSDWPVCLTTATYADVVESMDYYRSRFSLEEMLKIFGGNATEAYSLYN